MTSLQLQGIGDVVLHNEPILIPRSIEVAGDINYSSFFIGRQCQSIQSGTGKKRVKSRHSAMITQHMQGLNGHESKSLKDVNHKLLNNL